MRKSTFSGKLFLAFLVNVLLCFSVAAEGVTISDSLKDDVAAMITSSKKMPHQIFIVDSSDSMNSFAYSDYIDTCSDGEANLEKALALCNNAYQQCRNVEQNAMCDVDLNCGDVSTKCSQIETVKSKLSIHCRTIKESTYKEPDRFATVSTASNQAKLYVGPWNPSKTYNEDLCFYDWTADTHGDVLEGTSSADRYNQEKLGMTDEQFNNFKESSGGFIADRSDWDCLTDGSDKMKVGNTTVSLSKNPVSGLWLNWKYATSLDSLKIILGNVHSFSVQPRTRGENRCHKTVYKPKNTYKEQRLDGDGNPMSDGEGNPVIDDKNTCFVAFDPSLSNVDDAVREKELEALHDAIDSLWDAETKTPAGDESANDSEDPQAYKAAKCNTYDIKEDFSIYTKEQYVCGIDSGNSICTGGMSYPELTTTSSSGCDKCMAWKSNADGTGSFVETKCSSYSGSTITPEPAVLGSFSFDMNKKCCKATECANPHCRDNDVNCKTNQGTVGGNTIGYCASWEETCAYQEKPDTDPSCCHPNYECVLDHYSEFDQDPNHCCQELNCAEEGESSTYTDLNGNTCDNCKSGSVLGETSKSAETDVVSVITPDPSTPGVLCGADSGTDTCTGISVVVRIDDPSSIDFTPLDNIKFTVYYGCIGEAANKPSIMLGSSVCRSAADCPSVSGTLDGCSEAGYRMRAETTVTRNGCKYGDVDLDFDLIYSFDAGYKNQQVNPKTIFDPSKELYQVFEYQASSGSKKVYEYECKASFYNRELAVVEGSSCPSASQAPAYLNQDREGTPVEYCEARTLDSRTLATDSWGNPTKVSCSWLCRATEVYDDPWKCQSFFYMTDAREFNGINSCMNGQCTMDSVENIEDCCRCVNSEQGLYYHHQTPVGVDMSSKVSEGNTPKKCKDNHCVCAVSIYQYGTTSDGGRTEMSGYQAEIVNGHINEGTTPGYYNLVPYNVFNDTSVDSPYDGWYKGDSLLYSENGSKYLKDSLTSLFTTNDSAVRTPTCVYDVLWGWTGTDCDTACTSGCCSIDLSQDSNDCDYPAFWMKIPKGDGGKLLMGAKDLSSVTNIEEFRKQLKGLKAIGGSTLGETLYDAWRYLGGMYALHDSEYLSKRYDSPYENSAPECNTNEAIIISGGQPQYDHNDELNNMGPASDKVSCKPFNVTTADAENPCVEPTDTQPGQLTPYETKDWYNSSLLNVAAFVNSTNHSFWGTAECRSLPVGQNAKGCDPSELHLTGANVPRIDRVHTIAIGEWGLSAMYDTLKSSGTSGASGSFMDESFMQRVATQTKGFDNVKGKYFGLTATTNGGGTSDGGNFNDLTSLFAAFVSKSRESDVVVGRPHWTSSLVQPYDVEEKYRGPDAYVAGTVPVDGSVSRFWFGNLKKYNVDGGTECPITDDSDANCGEWKKQTFDASDCFAPATFDSGSDFGGTDSYSVEQYKKLMIGGAAYQLRKLIEQSPSCDTAGACFKVSKRKIYYDTNIKGSISELKNADISSGNYLYNKFREADPSITSGQIGEILDYMAGYDSFDDDKDGDRTHIRYSTNWFTTSTGAKTKTFEVDDPFNIDFNKKTKLTLRPLLLGAIVHSKPVAVFYDNDTTTRIYAGANDGMLHAFDGSGNEVYAYMPTLAIPAITNFKETESNIFFNATVDGPITLLHIDQSHDGIINGGEKAYLIFGYRRGAKGYTVIDVSDKDEPKFVQNINTDGGYSFGKAMVFRKCSGTCSYANDLEYYLAVPGGYDAACHDPAALTSMDTDNNITCTVSELDGNKFSIYKLNKSQGKFETAVTFDNTTATPSTKMTTFTKSWLVTSFTSVPFIVNTLGKAAVDTEYVYFNDLSGTVFRVDVTSSDYSDWTAKVVYTERDGGTGESVKTVPWAITSKSYVSSNFFPPLERYNPLKKSAEDPVSDWLIPVPIVTGNAANPRYVGSAEMMTVFYDRKGGAYDEFNSEIYTGEYLLNGGGNAHTQQNTVIDDKRGWRIVFNRDEGEKGITEPLVVYDIYGGKAEDSNSYSIAWNTFTPMKLTECRSFGTSSNYERYMLDGNQFFQDTNMTGSNGEWTVSADADSKCLTDSSKAKNISLATGVGIIASDTGYDLTFGAGADIFRKKQLTVKMNKTYIIKWYELY